VFRFVALTVALVALVAAAASPASDGKSAQPCEPFDTIEGPLGFETVTATDSISCEKATKILKKHDGSVDREDAFTEGEHFQLGDFRCGVRKFFTESARARCKAGDAKFRIDYGS
jgi:hypothetical protein